MSTNSTLPDQSNFHHAVLRWLARHPDGDTQVNIYEAVADAMNLNAAQRSERLRNMPHLRYRHRTGWSLGVLRKRGCVASSKSGIWRITDRGRDLLTRFPDGFGEMTLFQIIGPIRNVGPKDMKEEVNADESSAQATPEERIEDALDEIHRSVAEELLDRIAQGPPAFFEGLVLDLLHAMGYGTCENDLERVGAPGDGGIDGIISLDKLGFEKVYVQAKRWKGSVGRPEIQAFYGALAGRHARKGVFITTSGFTRDARGFTDQIPETIVLIDGTRLTTLMIVHGVGVSHHRVIRLPKTDDSYFEEPG